LSARAAEFARGMARGPIAAHRATKRQLYAEWNMGIRDAIIAEAGVQAELMQTRDFKRAYDAFTRRETPRFEGD
ncbi:MAG TPA: enoyl-CoA hydratase, partial [Candidatus Krumholzibacteria bacterium]|nr:enoyl-CoA hydratase [Candidatus Krumholzibacteria bacterium]